MPKTLKILAGIIIFLGILSGIFLLTAKKKTSTNLINQTRQKNEQTSAVPQKVATNSAAQSGEEKKKLATNQWQQCAQKKLNAETKLFWSVQIIEGIPEGGTYAKGVLSKNVALPVHITIKGGSANVDKIKQLLVVGKIPTLRGSCVDVTTDGAVVLEAF